MLAFNGLVQGCLMAAVESIRVAVPRGRCKVEMHQGIVSLSWKTNSVQSSGVVLSATQLEDYLEAGAILIIDRGELCNS
jgi:hypothetical protein